MRTDNTHLEVESLLNHPLVCVLPRDHPLAQKHVVTGEDIAAEPFISFAAGSNTRQKIQHG